MTEKFVDLGQLMAQQADFEATRIGIDGSLADLNTLEYGIERGLIGESYEALEAVMAGQLSLAKEEVIDVLIFIATVANHLGMTPDEVSETAENKMATNFKKYDPALIEGRTVADGMAYAKSVWVKPE
jgi:NTP pyrophosphatase (non-canonical NTP hydrolase)